MRVYGVTEGDARLPEAGDVVGRLYLDAAISKRLLDAARTLLRDHRAWLAAIEAKRVKSGSTVEIEPGGYDGTDPFDELAEERWRRAERTYIEAMDAVGAMTPHWIAVDWAVLSDLDVPIAMRVDLRRGLTRLADHYMIPASQKAA